MRKDFTDITLIVDRSGSMQSCQQEATMGVNAFIKEQAELPGEAVFTLVQFDIESDIVFNCVPIKDVKEYVLRPKGMTALYDALGMAINNTGNRLESMKEEDRPGLVVFAIITDGEENSSHEFTKEMIKAMIRHQEDKYNWKFTYLGANQDAFLEASKMGFAMAATATYSTKNINNAHHYMSANVTRMRSARMNDEEVVSSYTDEERSDMVK